LLAVVDLGLRATTFWLGLRWPGLELFLTRRGFVV
jgi:hypothetical protein